MLLFFDWFNCGVVLLDKDTLWKVFSKTIDDIIKHFDFGKFLPPQDAIELVRMSYKEKLNDVCRRTKASLYHESLKQCDGLMVDLRKDLHKLKRKANK